MARVISCDEIEQGMILAQPILNKFGQILLPANVELQKKHSQLLKTWGITSVTIKGEEGDDKEIEISEEMRLLIEENLKNKILWQPINAYEKEVYQLAFLSEAKKILHTSS
ncbi:MAG TPA: hypothetical protein PLI74_09795 [Candidatus Kapabacteria bacterium]|nr:hypothetical protein [Ignavibacteria bacterium]HRK59924.1 hypothetical protein [Candidatus Kapabacteria bacterium]